MWGMREGGREGVMACAPFFSNVKCTHSLTHAYLFVLFKREEGWGGIFYKHSTETHSSHFAKIITARKFWCLTQILLKDISTDFECVVNCVINLSEHKQTCEEDCILFRVTVLPFG
jgi:hypothetical protein